MDNLKYILYISIVWMSMLAIVVFAFTQHIEMKNVRIAGDSFVIGELSKNGCK